MKSLFKCERCGKVYDDYDECYRCEESHFIFSNEWTSDNLRETLDSMSEYKEGQEEPNVIHVWMKKTSFNNESGQWETIRRCGKYKLIASYDAPLIIDNE